MKYDVAIIGAGMAGASLAAAIGDAASVLILEGEERPGYHATGRSAAFWSETYGGPLIQPLTSASGPALAPFLAPRGAIHIADLGGGGALAALAAEFEGAGIALERLDRKALEARLPGLRPGWDEGLSEPGCADIDVAALHAACLRGRKLVTGARLSRAEREGRWRIETAAGAWEADILVNAAGAWADQVAMMAGERPIGIAPHRRTIAQLRLSPPVPADLPLVVDASGSFYFKPEAGGRLWLSPHDETPSEPCDCAAEEIDVAVAIDRLERVVDWRIEAVEHLWAGLRSFAPDRLPVYGYSGSGRGFFWCAGQGGFGIQTAPAAAALAARLLLGRPPGEIDPAPYLAARFGV
ncbi:MAG TPA: FAD-dependent oxidoreductase [Allosphingosinicella sp.]|nr:FAD-dependent oxidoreductase [Allosphingosinicella sp.]